MDSNNRHKLFPGEIFPVPGEAFVIQRQRKMPHMSIRLVRRQRLRHQMFPFSESSQKKTKITKIFASGTFCSNSLGLPSAGARRKSRGECSMGWSIPILRIAGIQLRIHITFLLLIAWLAFGYYAQGGSAVAASRVIFVLLLFLCVVLHEFGHAFAAKAFGINTPDITLLPIGGVARLERMPEGAVQELIIAAAGPTVNLIIAFCLFLTGGSFVYPPTTGSSLNDILLTINVTLLLFNLLPAFPMDGGRVLRALLATRLSYARATQIAASIGQACAFVFGFLGLFSNPFLLFIALFVYIGASQEAALAQMRDVSRRFPVSSAMVREFRSLPESATLEEA